MINTPVTYHQNVDVDAEDIGIFEIRDSAGKVLIDNWYLYSPEYIAHKPIDVKLASDLVDRINAYDGLKLEIFLLKRIVEQIDEALLYNEVEAAREICLEVLTK